MRLNCINKLLLCCFMCGNYAKVISVRKGRTEKITKLVTFVRLLLNILQYWVEHKRKDDRADWVTLNNTTFETEWVRPPTFSFYHSLCMPVKIVKIY